ncbi:MAG: winged helix-turn-helix domain-containing protein [Clostridia bacterium]|nr:winged helix-turn-helix domain-containing protein [Clostridia bacterium]
MAIPSYKSFFYLKNGISFKPSIKRVPLYFEFFNELLQRLIVREILIENDGKLDFNNVEKIADLDKADYNPSEYYKRRSKRLILQNLKSDPHISLRELANKTSYSTGVVRERLYELEIEGYIKIMEEDKKRYYIIKHEI